MINIIKGGEPTILKTCFKCGCVFTYEPSDVQPSTNSMGKITCPWCGQQLTHINTDAIDMGEVLLNLFRSAASEKDHEEEDR